MASTVFRQRLISTSATSLPLSVSALRVAGVTTPQRHATPPLHTTDRLEWLGARCEREVRYQHIKGAKLVDFTMQVHSARVGAVTRATNAVELRDDFSAIAITFVVSLRDPPSGLTMDEVAAVRIYSDERLSLHVQRETLEDE
eukprot:CAMPEP_0175829686 /NCGR_PEP_ID=MMETSP0107_2-20121207/13488_1 /TAXON_ID=195067 ORGANISM="Goniomonas pacifica, Strain CCMP1869" /NCGR_SAMPLE_ID=MMETSP0107_2 /ASSEMBLY_ACC=CAM_ASM_000203 /LENGTH=142 /DNA_ID=CAMNT_0017142523 /DNA_START=385 /DNA_END=811 /DNA_ORIENTATION=+